MLIKNLFSDDENVQHDAIVRTSAKLVTWVILACLLAVVLATCATGIFLCWGGAYLSGLWDG